MSNAKHRATARTRTPGRLALTAAALTLAVPATGILAAAPDAPRVIEFDAYSGDVFEGIAASLQWLSENDA